MRAIVRPRKEGRLCRSLKIVNDEVESQTTGLRLRNKNACSHHLSLTLGTGRQRPNVTGLTPPTPTTYQKRNLFKIATAAVEMAANNEQAKACWSGNAQAVSAPILSVGGQNH